MRVMFFAFSSSSADARNDQEKRWCWSTCGHADRHEHRLPGSGVLQSHFEVPQPALGRRGGVVRTKRINVNGILVFRGLASFSFRMLVIKEVIKQKASQSSLRCVIVETRDRFRDAQELSRVSHAANISVTEGFMAYSVRS